MKKRYLLLIPVAACVIACAAAVGYIQFHPEHAPAGTPSALVKTEEPAAQPEQAQEPEEPAELTADQKRAQEILNGMTLDQKIYQMMFVRPETLTNVGKVVRAGDATRKAIEEKPVGGIIYFSQNFQGTSQTTTMLSNTQEYARAAGANIPLFMGVDEEGGTVARVADVLGTTKFDDMADYGERADAQEAYDIGKTLATDISGFGFNVDFAPVADVLSNENNTEIGARSFGSDPSVVSIMVENEVMGLQESGVMAALKHFPGHGSTETNSHEGTSTTDRTLDELKECDLKPFEAGIDQEAAFVLVSHMTATELDSVPCSLSSKVITDLLRGEMGYNGIVITDGMDMGAITDNYSNGDAAVKAVQAGVDMLLCPPSIDDACEALSQAVADGEITEERIDESIMRILTAKLEYGLMN
ncbi:glycoside hydrolase family 3 protein [Butyricicoccus sp.]|uniref:glycoside hydrolase family 3 protein n=1 Tax=Butyricicoccus sp. TaxID=2049021 RepID=UPI0037351F53